MAWMAERSRCSACSGSPSRGNARRVAATRVFFRPGSRSSCPARDDLEIRVWSQGNALGHEVSSEDWLCCDPATPRAAELRWSSDSPHGRQPSCRSVPRSSAFTQMFEIFPSVIVSTSMVRICTSDLFGWMVPKGVSYGPVCRPRMMNATEAVGIFHDLQHIGAQPRECRMQGSSSGDKVNEHHS
jgi:hypothetical protein